MLCEIQMEPAQTETLNAEKIRAAKLWVETKVLQPFYFFGKLSVYI